MALSYIQATAKIYQSLFDTHVAFNESTLNLGQQHNYKQNEFVVPSCEFYNVRISNIAKRVSLFLH